jgi:hypothetical protein
MPGSTAADTNHRLMPQISAIIRSRIERVFTRDA